MPKKYNILVTAIGGDIGQSIARVLKRLEIVARIVGTDILEDHAGRFFADSCYQISKAQSPDFLKQIEDIVKKEKIDFIIPVSEPEIKVIYEAKFSFGWSPAILVMPQGNVLPACLDKLLTVRFLKQHGIPIPWTLPVAEGPPQEFPCILKDRSSWGSKSLIVIDNMETARFWAEKRPQAIFQELLLPEDEEYTCGVFRSRAGITTTIVFKRTLEGAQTGKALVVKDQSIEDLCQRVAEVFDLKGAMNIQLRKTAKGPVLFEINPRFSSTVIFRELIGFRDVLWSLLDLLGEDFEMPFSSPVGTRIYRVFTEKVINP